MYICNGVKYTRQTDLEGINCGLVIIDVHLKSTVRLIGVYRVFNPPGNVSQHGFFTSQLNLIKMATENRGQKKVLVLGDFNLNETMKFSNDYSHKSYFDELRLVFDPLGLIQMVEFETWKRLVNGVWRTSILDHVYTDDVMNISDLQPVETVIGDHVLIKMTLDDEGMNEQVISYKRDWTKYSKEKLVDELSICNMDWNVSDIQCYWNKIEEIIIRIIDKLAPITKYVDNVTSKSKTPLLIKRKLSQRKRLLRRLKQNPSEDLKIRMKNLNAEIKSHYIMNKRKRVRKGIVPGDSKSLWKAVNIARDKNSDEIPSKMFKNAVEVDENEIPESFAEYFASKISSLMVNIAIDPNVYNGNRRITSTEENFMTSQNILRAVQSIKMKNAEGGDRIPQRILIDGISVLIRPLSKLFEKIYEEKSIPEQWKMAKIEQFLMN